MTFDRVMELIFGMMVKNMLANGNMEFNMAKVNISRYRTTI